MIYCKNVRKIYSKINILLILSIILTVILASCDNQNSDSAAYTDRIYKEEDNQRVVETDYTTSYREAGTDESVLIRDDDYDVSGAVSLTSDEFMAMLIRDGDSYSIKPGVYRLTDYGVNFGASFNETAVNLTGVIL
jgi:hypothetical protein